MNPYVVLDVDPGADDETIRQAYLEAVKQSPPDHDGERFQEIVAAYEKIKDARKRADYFLFDNTSPGDSPLEVLAEYARFRSGQMEPGPLNQMKEWLRACRKS